MEMLWLATLILLAKKNNWGGGVLMANCGMHDNEVWGLESAVIKKKET